MILKRLLIILAAVLTLGFTAPQNYSEAAFAAPTDFCVKHPRNPNCTIPTPTPVATPSPTPTATPTATPSPTPTPVVTPTPTPVITPTPTPTVTPSPTPTPTQTPGVIGAIPTSGSGPLVCPEGYINWESRGWWTPTGEPFDQYRGVDAEICWPQNEFLPVGTTTFKLHIQLRRLPAPIKFVRIGFGPDGSVNGFYKDVTLTPDTAGFGEWYMDAPLKANTNAGYNEYRLTANVPSDEDGQRQYQSTGLQAWTTSNSTSYRTRPWWESRGWYPATDYVNNREHSLPPTPSTVITGIYSFKWECTRTGTGTLTYHVVYADADTHAIPMVLPHKYQEGNGGFNGTVSIDTSQLSNGRHKILTRCDDTVSTGTTSALTQRIITVSNAVAH